MNTPDLELYAYYKERERLAREMYILDQKINKHLFMQYSLKKAEQEAAKRKEEHRNGEQ